MTMTATSTHTKTLIAPDSGVADLVYGADYVSATSHTVTLVGTISDAQLGLTTPALGTPSSITLSQS